MRDIRNMRPGALPADWDRDPRSGEEGFRDAIDAARQADRDLTEYHDGRRVANVGGELLFRSWQQREYRCETCDPDPRAMRRMATYTTAEGLAAHMEAEHPDAAPARKPAPRRRPPADPRFVPPKADDP